MNFLRLAIISAFLIYQSTAPASAGAGDFWMRADDEIPFLPYWTFALIFWAVALVPLSIKYKRFRFALIPAISALIGVPLSLTIFPQLGVGLLFIFPVIITISAIYLFNSFKEEISKKSFARAVFRLNTIIIIFLLISAVFLSILNLSPKYLVSKAGKRSDVIERKLAQMEEKAVSALIDGLNSSDPATSAACARVMGNNNVKLPEAELYKILKRSGRKNGWSPRLEAAIAFGKKGSSEAVDYLLEAAFENLIYSFKDGKEKLKFDKAFYQASIDSIKSIEERNDLFTAADKACSKASDEADTYKASAWGLIALELGGEQSLQALEKIFGKIYKETQLMIIDSLKVNRDPAVLIILFRALDNQSVKVRRHAIDALEGRDELIVIYKLIITLNDAEPEIRDKANRMLIDITGEDFGFNTEAPRKARIQIIKKWTEWWIEQARE